MNGRFTRLAVMTALLVGAVSNGHVGTDDATEQARAALDDGDAQRAVELLADHPSPTAESHYVLGLAYQVRLDEVGLLAKRGVARRLRRALHDALEKDPAHVGAREELADFYHYAPAIVGGSTAKRDEQIELLRQYAPAAAELVRARHAFDAGEHRDAERHATAALTHDDTRADAWFLRGRARQEVLEKDADALADFKRALELGLDDDRIHYYMGSLCVRLQVEPELAERSLLTYIERAEPRNRAWAHYRLAMLREQQGRLEDALAEADRAITLRPELEEAEAVRRRVLEKLGS